MLRFLIEDHNQDRCLKRNQFCIGGNFNESDSLSEKAEKVRREKGRVSVSKTGCGFIKYGTPFFM